MSNDIETRDKAILDAIAKLSTDLNQRMDKLEESNKKLEKDLNDLRVGQAEIKGEIKALDNKIDGVEGKLTEKIDGIEGKLTEKIDAVEGKLTEKIDGIEKRVGNLEFLNRVGVSSLIGGIIALIIKIFI